MAQNDMYVVMYKILAYLYDCMKKGESPDREKYGPEALGIPEPYWTQIMLELIDHGFVKGFLVIRRASPAVVAPNDPSVTLEGVAFAQENTMMARAKQFLQDAKAAIPFI